MAILLWHIMKCNKDKHTFKVGKLQDGCRLEQTNTQLDRLKDNGLFRCQPIVIPKHVPSY